MISSDPPRFPWARVLGVSKGSIVIDLELERGAPEPTAEMVQTLPLHPATEKRDGRRERQCVIAIRHHLLAKECVSLL